MEELSKTTLMSAAFYDTTNLLQDRILVHRSTYPWRYRERVTTADMDAAKIEFEVVSNNFQKDLDEFSKITSAAFSPPTSPSIATNTQMLPPQTSSLARIQLLCKFRFRVFLKGLLSTCVLKMRQTPVHKWQSKRADQNYHPTIVQQLDQPQIAGVTTGFKQPPCPFFHDLIKCLQKQKIN